jgi:S-adenosylmethionine/arginine decarboxylase-like enzyme
MILKHQHLIVRSEVTKPPTTKEEIVKWVKELVPKIHMKLMGEPQAFYCDKAGNRGATCAAIIETSHIVMHVWDEKSPALIQLDIYSCSDLHEETVFQHFKQFNPVKTSKKLLDREQGLIDIPTVEDYANIIRKKLESKSGL